MSEGAELHVTLGPLMRHMREKGEPRDEAPDLRQSRQVGRRRRKRKAAGDVLCSRLPAPTGCGHRGSPLCKREGEVGATGRGSASLEGHSRAVPSSADRPPGGVSSPKSPAASAMASAAAQCNTGDDQSISETNGLRVPHLLPILTRWLEQRGVHSRDPTRPPARVVGVWRLHGPPQLGLHLFGRRGTAAGVAPLALWHRWRQGTNREAFLFATFLPWVGLHAVPGNTACATMHVCCAIGDRPLMRSCARRRDYSGPRGSAQCAPPPAGRPGRVQAHHHKAPPHYAPTHPHTHTHTSTHTHTRTRTWVEKSMTVAWTEAASLLARNSKELRFMSMPWG